MFKLENELAEPFGEKEESKQAESEHDASKRAEPFAEKEEDHKPVSGETQTQEKRESDRIKKEKRQKRKTLARKKRQKRKEKQQVHAYRWEYIIPTLLVIAAGLSLYSIGIALFPLAWLTGSIFVLSYASVKLIQAGKKLYNRFDKISTRLHKMIRNVDDQIGPITKRTNKTIDKLEDTIENMNQVIHGTGIEFNQTLKETNKMLLNVNQQVNNLLDNANAITQQVNHQINPAIEQLKQTFTSVHKTLEATGETIKEAERTFHHVNDGAQTVRTLVAPLTLAREIVNDISEASKDKADDDPIPTSHGFFSYYREMLENAISPPEQPPDEFFEEYKKPIAGS